jgi:hypothetical protein
MSREEEAKIVRLYDNRTIERTIRKGLITRKDYEKYLKSLPDVSDKAAPADLSGVEDDDLEMDDEDDIEDDVAEPEGGGGSPAS